MNSLSLTAHSIPPSRFLRVGINPRIGEIRCTTTYETGKRPRTIFQSDQDRDLACAREKYRQEKLEERKKRREQSTSNPEHSTAVNIKECLLEVQTLYMKQLAAKENHVKEVAKIPGATTIEFEKNRKEVERVIEALWSRERTTAHHGL